MFYLFVSVSVIRPNSLFRFNLISSFYSKQGQKKKFIAQHKTICISRKRLFPYFHSAEKLKLNTSVKQNVIAIKSTQITRRWSFLRPKLTILTFASVIISFYLDVKYFSDGLYAFQDKSMQYCQNSWYNPTAKITRPRVPFVACAVYDRRSAASRSTWIFRSFR